MRKTVKKVKLAPGPHYRTGAFIRARREELNFSQAVLTDAIDYTQKQFISRIENGHAPLPRKYIQVVADTLKIDPALIINVMLEDYRASLEAALPPQSPQSARRGVARILPPQVTAPTVKTTTTALPASIQKLRALKRVS